MRLLLLLSCSLVLLSCENESTGEVVKEFPKYPDHPITYELKDNKLTVYRHYVSEWCIDSVTFERVPLDYKVFPDLPNGNQGTVDRFHWEMVDSGVYLDPIPYHIVVDENHPFNSVYHSLFVPIMYDLSRSSYRYPNNPIENRFVTWKDITINIKPRNYNNAITVYFKEEIPHIEFSNNDTTLNEPLTKGNAALVEELFPYKCEEINSDDQSYNPTKVFISTNGESITAEQMYSALEYFESGEFVFQFSFENIDTYRTRLSQQQQQSGSGGDVGGGKPIIYLYPEEVTDISVKLDTDIRLTFTYPRYPDSGWRVQAKPSGDLLDLSTDKEYYSLFWEGYINCRTDFSEGFLVSSEEVVPFLEEKLEILGLNYREAQEFILYWAPMLEQNEFSTIHFSTDEYNNAVPLEIVPEPETLIRILMSFQEVDSSFQTEEQELIPVERSGYTVVEWGGSNYDVDLLAK